MTPRKPLTLDRIVPLFSVYQRVGVLLQLNGHVDLIYHGPAGNLADAQHIQPEGSIRSYPLRDLRLANEPSIMPHKDDTVYIFVEEAST